MGAIHFTQVVKKSGVIIKPIEYEEVDPHRKVEEQKQGGQKQKRKNGKSNSGKTAKKMKKAGA